MPKYFDWLPDLGGGAQQQGGSQEFQDPGEPTSMPAEAQQAPPATSPAGTPSDATLPYSQRRAQATSNIFKSADSIINRYTNVTGNGVADATRRLVRADPENAARHVEKFYNDNAYNQRVPDEYGKSHALERVPPLYDQEFTNLENHVRNLRSMKRGVEEQALQGGINATDVTSLTSQRQNLQGQLDALTKDITSKNLPEAVSQRGEAANRQALGDKQQQAAAIGEHIAQIDAQLKAAQPQGPEDPNAPSRQDEELQQPPPIKNLVNAAGVPYHKFVNLATVLGQQLSTAGWNLDGPITGMAMHAIPTMLEAMGEHGQQRLKEMYEDAAPQQPENPRAPTQGPQNQPTEISNPDMTQKAPGQPGGPLGDLDQQFQDEHAAYRQKLQQLGQLKTFNSGWDVFFYCLTSLIGGHRLATALFTNHDKAGTLRNELDLLHRDMTLLTNRREAEARLQEAGRRNAAMGDYRERSLDLRESQGQQRQDLSQKKFEYKQQHDSEYLELRRQSMHYKDPTLDALGKAILQHKNALDEARQKTDPLKFSRDEVTKAKADMAQYEGLLKQARAAYGKALQRVIQEKGPMPQQQQQPNVNQDQAGS